jgi:16S rRNA C967 or C1407 C5-methylase (RsmB/RsmF family)
MDPLSSNPQVHGTSHVVPTSHRLQDGTLLKQLQETQFSLISNAVELLDPQNPDAEVWYMTCSILRDEDEVGVWVWLGCLPCQGAAVQRHYVS